VLEYEGDDELIADPSLMYTKVVEYYPNGTEKQICEYKNDVLRSKTEYPYQENFEDYITDGTLGSVDSLILYNGQLTYLAGEDGTYSTNGWYGTKTYTYYESGELKSQESYDEKGAGSAESYYPGGKRESKAEYTFTEDGKGKIKFEEYHENGVLALSGETIYTTEFFRGQYASYYGERYDENGVKTADFRYDPESSVIVTTMYDEEGNITEQTEEKYYSGIIGSVVAN
jgi:antitoxin component YwqK of YwqJK toxin-antitoxin module